MSLLLVSLRLVDSEQRAVLAACLFPGVDGCPAPVFAFYLWAVRRAVWVAQGPGPGAFRCGGPGYLERVGYAADAVQLPSGGEDDFSQFAVCLGSLVYLDDSVQLPALLGLVRCRVVELRRCVYDRSRVHLPPYFLGGCPHRDDRCGDCRQCGRDDSLCTGHTPAFCRERFSPGLSGLLLSFIVSRRRVLSFCV